MSLVLFLKILIYAEISHAHVMKKQIAKDRKLSLSLDLSMIDFKKKVIFFVEKRGHDSLMISDLTL